MNRHDRRAHGAHDGIARAPNGFRFAVIRPEDAAKALALAKQALETQDRELMANLPDHVGCKYTFVGWLSQGLRKHLVDASGNRIGQLQPGDSFVVFENDDPSTSVKIGDTSP